MNFQFIFIIIKNEAFLEYLLTLTPLMVNALQHHEQILMLYPLFQTYMSFFHLKNMKKNVKIINSNKN
jgi:hypothetical protein